MMKLFQKYQYVKMYLLLHFVATDTIKFIDENIKRFPCNRSSSNQYVTTAPKEFVDKCNNKIFAPAIDREWQRRTQEKMKGVPNA